jgi:phosphoribosyl isomerase A
MAAADEPTSVPDPTYAQAPGELTLLPAVDVQSGTAVRLVEGRAGTETEYGDPLAAAKQWVEQGASWLHLVDLDAAFRRGENRALIAEVVAGVGIPVEVSGGIRDDESLAAALATGAARVIIGTAALEDPDWVAAVIAAHGDRIAVSLDVRGHTLAARGWTTDGGNLWEALERLDAQGCARYIVTDVAKDGTMKGPNLHLLREVLERTKAPVIASGGIAHVGQLHELQQLVPHGMEGAIIGKALYEGAFTLAEAIAAVEPTKYYYEWNPPND